MFWPFVESPLPDSWPCTPPLTFGMYGAGAVGCGRFIVSVATPASWPYCQPPLRAASAWSCAETACELATVTVSNRFR